ncbi:calcium-binding protein [Aromatoleum evansii]|uniref:Calcium-binding protein n=1 Tax=Aromatoleum evansii TaxID=59406 RepID=A0ABZ1AL90_AROEV|nr:calcium-binding protein [Aromatoleum evansii]
MASFSNVNNTLATIDAGFSYADYADTLLDAADSMSYALDTVAYGEPMYWDMYGNDAWIEWADGTAIYAGFSSVGTSSATIDELNVYGPYTLGMGWGWLAAEGSGKVEFNQNDGITSASVFTLKSATLGGYSDAYDAMGDLTLKGSMKLNLDTGGFSGKATSVTMKWSNDNPTTPDVWEWDYVTLKGSISLGSAGLDFSGISGKITGIEWGTALEAYSDEDNVQFVASGSASGLKLDAASAMNALEADGFAGLSASIYSGNDTITGTAGDDYLDASTGNDKVNGGEGADEIYGGAGNDQLTGGAGNDYIDGGAGNDKISDDSGNNTIVDESGNAQITLGAGHDDVFTGAGNDKIAAGDGVNWIEAGAGNDNITSGSGADFIFAGSGNDKVVAGDGDNWIDGGAGNDTITTGAGADLIYGGEGADKISGGAGIDAFVFDNLAIGGKDLIKDFNAAEDVFAFDTTVFGSLAGGITSENVVIGAKAVALATDDYLIFDTQGGKLYYDADGSGGNFAAVQIAVVKGSLTGLDADNFIQEAALFA